MHFKKSSAGCFNLNQSKILSSGNGLKNEKKPWWFVSIFFIFIISLHWLNRSAYLPNVHENILDRCLQDFLQRLKMYSPIILINILCLFFLQDFMNVKVTKHLIG